LGLLARQVCRGELAPDSVYAFSEPVELDGAQRYDNCGELVEVKYQVNLVGYDVRPVWRLGLCTAPRPCSQRLRLTLSGGRRLVVLCLRECFAGAAGTVQGALTARSRDGGA
jgi:hypothetical protein